MPKKKDEKKKPLDMTTDEAMEYLFPTEAIGHLRDVAREAETKKLKSSAKSQKHSS